MMLYEALECSEFCAYCNVNPTSDLVTCSISSTSELRIIRLAVVAVDFLYHCNGDAGGRGWLDRAGGMHF